MPGLRDAPTFPLPLDYFAAGRRLHGRHDGTLAAILNRLGAASESSFTAATLAGTRAITSADPRVLVFDPDGASRDVTLPAESVGSFYWIRNTGTVRGTDLLVVKDDGGGTILTLDAGDAALFVSNGTTWTFLRAVDERAELDAEWTANAETLAATKTLTASGPRVHALDPDGASRNVDLPAEAAGEWFLIRNTGTVRGTDLLAIRDDAAGAVLTLDADEAALVVCTGAAWTYAHLESHKRLLTGTATVANGTTSIAVNVGASFDGAFATVSFASSPGSATYPWAGAVSGGNLTINVDTDPGTDIEVAYCLDGR